MTTPINTSKRGFMSLKYDLLLVEDDEVDIMSIEKSIKNASFIDKMHIAKNGLEGLEALKKITSPVIVLLDLKMPVMNGFEFLEELRKNEKLKNTPVIVLTSSELDIDIEKAYSYNVAGYITKPLNIPGNTNLFDYITIFGNYWGICKIPTK